jgi:phosphohistidine phosphatase SixA
VIISHVSGIFSRQGIENAPQLRNTAFAMRSARLLPIAQNSGMFSAFSSLHGLLTGAFLILSMPAWAQAAPSPACQGAGCVILYRHAIAPGGGDPPGFDLKNCASQRNLSPEGRTQAKQLGLRLKLSGVAVGAIWHSEWCRTRETAQLMQQAYNSTHAAPGKAVPEPKAQSVFNSFFAQREQAAAQTAQARKLLQTWRGPGTLIVVTHQVNITELTGIVPQSGEGVALRMQGNEIKVLGQIPPP